VQEVIVQILPKAGTRCTAPSVSDDEFLWFAAAG